mmetsp:Transcript_66799/g.157318  ORF Transcript_66799/g.157318 Transcript_66799/m.157318 type:complete len:210 (+) Transcript_66799:72-701(+)
MAWLLALLIASALAVRQQEQEQKSALLGEELAGLGAENWAGKCAYVPPQEVAENEGYRGMEKLTQAGWKADVGDADAEHVLFYAYGPMLRNRGQIAAWKYNEQTQYIEFWYSKSHCPGMCDACCDGGESNMPKSVFNKALNPSADQGWLATSYKLVNKFKDGDDVDFGSAFGKFTLRKKEGRWVLWSKGKFLDHVYACDKSTGIPGWRN